MPFLDSLPVPDSNSAALGKQTFRLFLLCLCAALALVLSAGTAHATDGKVFRSARLTYLSGDVRVEQAGNTATSEAVVNLPVVEGAVISTGDDGQAEVEFEDGSLLRLTPRSGAALVNLSVDSSGEYHSRVSILGGLAYVELRAGTKYHYIVDAGGDEITPIENTILRVNFDETPAAISVLDGSAHLTAASGSDVAATAGQTVRASATSEGGAYSIKEGIAPESWDQWNLDRDGAAANEASTETDVRSKYAGDQGYGWADLDASGNWYDVPGQGEIWQPDAAAQPGDGSDAAAQSPFDPYGYGSWAYTPAGYVWASGYGWGWLPYHCGSWNYWDGFGWGWTPNLNCGVYGFGGYFDGGVYIGRLPYGYKKPGRPLPKPGPVHPIVRGRGGPVPVATVDPIDRIDSRERVIAGNTVTPLPRRAGGVVAPRSFTGNTRAVLGAGLQRDYPVDRTTHSPVLGMAPSGGAPFPSSNARAAWHPVRPANASNQPPTGSRPGYSRPDGSETRPAPVIRQAPSSQPRQSAPAPAPASHPAAGSSGHGK